MPVAVRKKMTSEFRKVFLVANPLDKCEQWFNCYYSDHD